MSITTSSYAYGNIFCVTCPLCEDFFDDRWIPHTKASDAEFWCFLWKKNAWVNNRDAGDLRRHHARYDVVTVTHLTQQNSITHVSQDIRFILWNFSKSICCNVHISIYLRMGSMFVRPAIDFSMIFYHGFNINSSDGLTYTVGVQLMLGNFNWSLLE